MMIRSCYVRVLKIIIYISLSAFFVGCATYATLTLESEPTGAKIVSSKGSYEGETKVKVDLGEIPRSVIKEGVWEPGITFTAHKEGYSPETYYVKLGLKGVEFNNGYSYNWSHLFILKPLPRETTKNTQPVQPPPPPPPPPKVPSATANVRELTRITNDATPELFPRVSPDGKILLFQSMDYTKKDKSEASSLVSVTIGSPGRQLLAGPYTSEPAWFPDGKNIIYSYLKTQNKVLARQGFGHTGMTYITPSAMGEDDSQANVKPDSSKIAFHTKLGKVTEVCIVDSKGTDFTVYTEGASPRWHPTKDILAFDRQVGDFGHIFTIDLLTGQVTQLTTGTSKNWFPVWSPDGEWIAFLSNREGKYHIYIMKKDGSMLTQLTQGEAIEYFPEWSSDNYIYFTSNAGAPTTENNPWAWTYSDIWRLKPVLPE